MLFAFELAPAVLQSRGIESNQPVTGLDVPFLFAGKPGIRRIAVCPFEDPRNRENDRDDVNDLSRLQEEPEGCEAQKNCEA